MYDRFLEILRLSKSGLNGYEIGRQLHMNNVRKFLTGTKKSSLTHLRTELDRLGPPGPAHKWLPLRLKPRGTPDTTWVDVPIAPLDFADVQSLLERVTPTTVEPEVLTKFGFYSYAELESERVNLFGFLLGAVVGDSTKNHKGILRFNSMSLSMMLSKNKLNSFRFGEFFALCGNASLGLNVHRISDPPVSKHRFGKTECYCWLSSSSPLVSWLFNECLGLRNDETTTYDPLRMEWLLSASKDFKIHFIQGLGESDGWPDAGDDLVKLVSSPNTQLFHQLLEGLGCPSQEVEQPPVELLRCKTEDAMRLPFFSPRIKSNLYLDTLTLAHAKRYPERLRLPQETIDLIVELSKVKSKYSEICSELAKTIGYKVTGRTVKKYSFA